jgi:hypothetical protein
MAAVTKGTLRPVTIAGYEVVDTGQAKTALAVGDLVVINSDTPANGNEKVWAKAAITGITEAMGIVILAAVEGGPVSVGIVGEMDGYASLTPGAPLYPSTAAAGGTDTSSISGAVVRMRAVSTTRVRYAFV